MKLSVLVIAKNEEKKLAGCLATAAFADEIVVIDSGSTDKTVEIAKKYTDKVFFRAFDDFGAQKNFAVSKASGDWILFLDADERVPEALAKQISDTIRQSGDHVAFRIPRRTYFLGKRFRFSGTQDDRPVRLFKRGSGCFEQPIHEYYRCDGPVGDLDQPMIHHTTPSVEVEINKTEFYTDLEARFLKNQNIKPEPWNFLRPLLVFINLYFRKLGFLDGGPGFWFAYYSALYDRRKYQKLKDLYRLENLEPKINALFDDFAKNLPDRINRSDSRLRALLDACGPLKDKKVLEVGCGKGRFAAVMIERGAELTGIDPSETLLKDARKLTGGTFLQSSASGLPFAAETFDVVYVVEVIGHLPALHRSIQEMSRVLKRGGLLLILDRNRYSLNQKRFLVPNVLIKRWHELKNHWIYPNGFPFREKWFTRQRVLRLMGPYFKDLSAEFVLSDGERNCSWHGVFESAPFFRLFILWRGAKK